ncbi:MAG: ParB/RepB/Spo0J family partition protein, partial [Gemmatimonadota bacterium]
MTTQIVELELRFLETPYQGLRIRNPKIERALLASLEETEQQFPITVIRGERSGAFVVIDGHRRVRALKRLGRDVVRARVLDLSAAEALLWVRVGQANSALSALEEGLLLEELIEGQGLGVDVITARVGRSKSWVTRRLCLIQV